MKTLVIVNGFPRSGKDTFIDFCINEINDFYDLEVTKHSTIDTVKCLAADMGWTGEKTPEMRRMLSELKDLYTKYFDGPLNEIKAELKYNDIVFTCMREPDEIVKTVSWCKENDVRCITLLVRAKGREEVDHTSHSDSKVLDYAYKYTIDNDGTLKELDYLAINFCESHF